MFYLNGFNTIEAVLIMVSFFVLFFLFINDKYPLKIFSHPIILFCLVFLVVLHGNNILTFIYDEHFDYIRQFLFIVSFLTFSLKAFIFRV